MSKLTFPSQSLPHYKLKGRLHTLLSFLLREMSVLTPSAVAGVPQVFSVLHSL